MHMQGFVIDLDDVGNIGYEIGKIIQAANERAIATTDKYKRMEDDADSDLEDHRIQVETLGEVIDGLRDQVAKMHDVPASEMEAHRATLLKIQSDLAAINLEPT